MVLPDYFGPVCKQSYNFFFSSPMWTYPLTLAFVFGNCDPSFEAQILLGMHEVVILHYIHP